MKKLYEESDVQAIADAIRSKNSSEDKLKITQMADEIEAIDLTQAYQSVFDKSITMVDLPNITDIANSYLFRICKELLSVNLPNVKNISGEYVFTECSKLTNVNIANAEILSGTAMFALSNIKHIDISKVTILGRQIFYGTPIEKIILPNAISIGAGCFYSCSNLIYAEFGKAVSIGNTVFRKSGLKTLVLRATDGLASLASSATYVLGETPIISGTGYIYVPSALIDSYKTATNWTTCASQFRALEDYTIDGTTDGELDETKI